MRKVVFVAAMIVLALSTFVFAAQAVFPYDRVKARIEDAAAPKVDLTIGKIERGIMPGVFYLEDVVIKTYPKQEELDKANAIVDAKEHDKAIALLTTTTFVEKIKVNVGLLALVRSTASIDFDVTLGAGSISGSVAVSKDGTTAHVVGRDVPSNELPMREVLSNLPMSGAIEFELDLDMPNDKLKNGKTGVNWPKAAASLDFACPAGCTLGDGRARLKLTAKNERSQQFVGEGVPFGPVQVSSLVARVDVSEGKLELTKFEIKSDDVDLFVDYSMALAQDLNESTVNGCVRYKGKDALKKRESKTFDQILLIGGLRNSADGLDHVKLAGKLKEMSKTGKALCGPGFEGKGVDSPTTSRPNLVVHPDDAPRLGSSAIPRINPPPPPVAPPVAPIDAGVTHQDATLDAPAGVELSPPPPPAPAGSADGSASQP